MMKMLSAIIIIFNFLHILVKGSVKEIQAQVQHQQHLQLQVQHPQLHVTPPQLHQKKHRKHLHPPHTGPHPHPLPIPTQPLPHPQVPEKKPPQPSSLREMYDDMTSSKPQLYLASHNEFRAKMGVPPLQWDKKLEDYALAYGQKCAADCRLQHSHGPYGENLFWELYEETGPEQVVKSFTDEQQNYDLTKGECKCQQETSKCMCGHFTAIIWKTTERVGCAETRCEADKGKLIVCSYDPPGNVIGQDPLHTQ